MDNDTNLCIILLHSHRYSHRQWNRQDRAIQSWDRGALPKGRTAQVTRHEEETGFHGLWVPVTREVDAKGVHCGQYLGEGLVLTIRFAVNVNQ